MYNIDYSWNWGHGAAFAGAFIMMMLFMVILSVGVYVLTSLFLMKLFKKAGIKEWQAWVPFLNMWRFLELGGQQGWLVLLPLLSFIPVIGWVGAIVSYVFMVIAAYNIGKKLDKSEGFVVLYIFLSIVWLGICGFDKSKWNEAKGAKSLIPIKPAK